jgi:hypothetical protein
MVQRWIDSLSSAVVVVVLAADSFDYHDTVDDETFEVAEDGTLEGLGAAVVEAVVLLLLDWIEDLQLDLIPQQEPTSEATLLELVLLPLDKGFEFYHNLYRDTGW